MVLYLCVLIVFSLHRESLKLILVNEPLPKVVLSHDFHEFCWFTIIGTSDDGKAPYGPKSIHILIMSKTRGVHEQYDMKWHKARVQRISKKPFSPRVNVSR
jgi:hypothetical protein